MLYPKRNGDRAFFSNLVTFNLGQGNVKYVFYRR